MNFMVCELYFNLKRKGRKEDKESLSIDVRVRIVRGEDFCLFAFLHKRQGKQQCGMAVPEGREGVLRNCVSFHDI